MPNFVFTTLFSDTFHRADEQPLNPATWNEFGPPDNVSCAIVSDECVGNSQIVHSDNYPKLASYPNDQWSSFQVDSMNLRDNSTFVLAEATLRNNLSDFNGTAAGIQAIGSTNVRIYTYTNLQGGTVHKDVAFVAGAVLKGVVLGTTAYIYYNNVLLLTQDASWANSSGPMGIFISDNLAQSDVKISHFAAGSVKLA